MFTKSRKDKFVEQAQELAQDLSDALAPHVERAREEIAPRIADARDNLAPHVESAREKFVKDVVPAVQAALEDAREQAAPVAEEARRRGVAAAAALKGEPVQEKSGKKKWVVLAVLAGAGAFIARKLSGSGESQNWQSSYTPTPAPAAPPAPPSPSAPAAGAHAADGDAGGAAPGESLSDAAEEPHPVTTPDSPAEDVDVADKPDPKA